MGSCCSCCESKRAGYQDLRDNGYLTAQPVYTISLVESSVVAGYDAKIPNALIQIKQYLVAINAFSTEGIFRISAQKQDADDILNSVMVGAKPRAALCTNVHALCSAIKLFFRRLSPTLLPRSLFRAPSTPQHLLSQLDEPNKSWLVWLLDVCVLAEAQSASSRMNAHNLGIVLAPNLVEGSAVGNGDPLKELKVARTVADWLAAAIRARAEHTV